MNRILIVIFLSSFIVIFFLGIFVGVYKYFPYSELNNLKNQLEGDTSVDPRSFGPVNLDDKISLQNTNDLAEKRQELIQFIWKTNSLPKQLPNSVDTNISDERFTSLTNLKQIDRLTIEMEYGLSSIVYIFSPQNNNGDVIFYHQGHSGGFINGKSTIQKFLDNGFTIAAFSMPLIGLNNQPVIELENIGQVRLFKHDQFLFLESENFSSMSYFFTPLSVTLNHMSKNYSIDNFHMVGISGGGWTSTIYPALDSRITKSFSVAGSLPLSLRTTIDDVGDYEQYNPEFYSIANYMEFYIMSSYGENRKHIQVYNKFDPCCFAVDSLDYFEKSMTEYISKFNSGNFAIIIDDTIKQHNISEYTLDLIITEIKN